MNLLRWHLWREWREQRVALLMLFFALPLLAWGFASIPPKKALGDPLLQSGAALTFVVVVLVATGGELLGAERRGSGLRWLERLPSGLGSPFLAKLLFLVVSVALAALYGFGVARSIALLRGVEPKPISWEPISFFAGLALVLWTFACSAWALRGGVAIFAAVLVLGVVGYPAWLVVSAGYSPSGSEISIAGLLLISGALLASGLGFLCGGRFGRGTGKATLLGLAPAVPLLALSTGWSLDRFDQRERLDPLAEDFYVHWTLLSEDAGHAFLFVSHFHDPRWSEMPVHVLDVALENGSWNRVGGHYLHHEVTSAEVESALFRPDQLALWTDEREQPFVFDLSDGRAAEIEVKSKAYWRPLGLGQVIEPPREKQRIRDPFRGRDYLTEEISFWDSYWETDVLVRPGRWICREEEYSSWFLYDPDTQVREPLGLAEYDQLIAFLKDGQVIIDPVEGPAFYLDPDTGGSRPITGSEHLDLYENEHFFREPGANIEERHPLDGPIVLRTNDWPAAGWYVLDREAMKLRYLPVQDGHEETYLRGLAPDRALLLSDQRRLLALDLETGARRLLFPLPPAN